MRRGLRPGRAALPHPQTEGREGKGPLPAQGPLSLRAPRSPALTVVGHGQHLVAGAAVVVDDGGGGAALGGQADLVGEGAAAAALDEGEPARGAACRGGPAEVGEDAAGIEGVGAVGQHQQPLGRLQRRVQPVQAALARLPAALVAVRAVLPRHVQPGSPRCRRRRRPAGPGLRDGAKQRGQRKQRGPRRHPSTARRGRPAA